MEPKPALLSPAEYLEREEKNPVKSEYVDGEVYAMSVAKRRHNLIASNLVRRAREAADNREGCQVFGSGMKVYVEAYNTFYHPDLSVCCDGTDRNELFLMRPCFIVEVSSPSTASIDRREKRRSYTTLESLRECAIVDQDRMRVEDDARATVRAPLARDAGLCRIAFRGARLESLARVGRRGLEWRSFLV